MKLRSEAARRAQALREEGERGASASSAGGDIDEEEDAGGARRVKVDTVELAELEERITVGSKV